MHDIERTDTSDTTMADAFARAGFDTDTVIETDDGGEDDGPRAQSQTAIACEQAALFGATPERDEFDTRDVWDQDDATAAVSEAFRIVAQGVAPDGFQLADERESLLWGLPNATAPSPANIRSPWRLPQISGCRSAQPFSAGAFMKPRSRASMCAPS